MSTYYKAPELIRKFPGKFVPCFVSFFPFIHPDGRVVKTISMAWRAAPGTKLQIFHTTDAEHWEARPDLITVPQSGQISDTAEIATGPWDMAFIVEQPPFDDELKDTVEYIERKLNPPTAKANAAMA